MVKQHLTIAPAPTATDSAALSRLIVQGMLDKKAAGVAVIDLRPFKSAVADFYIICSGTSDMQMEAISDSVEETVHRERGEDVWHREGKLGREWMLLDYGDCVAHIFLKPKRNHYGLEQLWGDADITYFDEFGRASEVPTA